MKVTILSDGIPGHLSQSRGLINWLRAAGLELEVQELKLTLKARALSRPLLRWALNRQKFSLAQWLCQRCYRGFDALDGADLIISAGGNLLFANACLARRHSAKNLVLSSLRGLHPEHFSAVLTLEPIHARNNVVMPFAPTPILPGQLDQACQQHFGGPLTEPVWALIIGGDGAGYHYQAQDWQLLAEMANQVAHQRGIKWLITSSRRTGAEAEQLLRAHLDPECVLEATWYSCNPAKVMAAYLGAAQAIWVSADSMTMVTECISSNKTTFAFEPALSQPNARYQTALAKVVGHSGGTICPISQLIQTAMHPKSEHALSDLRQQTVQALLQTLAINLNEDI